MGRRPSLRQIAEGQLAALILIQVHPEIVDQLITFSEKDLFQKGFFSKIFTLCKIWKQIAFRKFEKIYILHKDIRYAAIPLFSFGKKTRLKQNKNFFPNIYQAKQYLSLVDPRARIKYPEIVPPLKEEFFHLFSKSPCIFLAPGGAKNPLQTAPLKRWPISYYVELCNKLLFKGFTVALIGNETDEWRLPYFSNLPIKNLVGKTSLLDLIALFNKGKLLITHDTGVMHLGKLTSINVCALFGPTNPLEFAPTTKKMLTILQGNQLSYYPCYNNKILSDGQKNICIQWASPTVTLGQLIKKYFN